VRVPPRTPPRGGYQIDATELALATGEKVVVFDVLDDCTRLLVACQAARAETSAAAIAAISAAAGEFGAPGIVLSDNGSAFTGRGRHANAGPTAFARTVTGWGSRLIHASPYHPQTCGKVERHHQTLKRWLAHQPQPPATVAQLQALLDTYRADYNTRRPQPITIIRDGHRATAYTSDGDPIGHIHLDTTKRYQGKLAPAG